MYAIALFVFNITATVSIEQHIQRMVVTGMRVRSTIVGAIYEKALIVSNAARKGKTDDNVVAHFGRKSSIVIIVLCIHRVNYW